MHYQNKGPYEAGPVLLMLVAQALHEVKIDELNFFSCDIHWVSLEKNLNIGISPNKTPTSASVSCSKMLLKNAPQAFTLCRAPPNTLQNSTEVFAFVYLFG
jgi:hypothetical protein